MFEASREGRASKSFRIYIGLTIEKKSEEKQYQQNQHKQEDSLLRNMFFLNILENKVNVSYRKGVYRE